MEIGSLIYRAASEIYRHFGKVDPKEQIAVHSSVGLFLGISLPNAGWVVPVISAVSAGLITALVQFSQKLFGPTLDTVGKRISERWSDAPQEGGQILLVDDDVEYRALLGASLGAGVHVEHADNLAEALAAIKNLPPAAIVLDLKMPYSGSPSSVVACVRAIYKGKIVLASALPEPAIDDLAKKHHALWIRKPFNRDQLLDLLK